MKQAKQAITYIDDTKMQLQTEVEMFEINDEHHYLLRKMILTARPEKTNYFIRIVNSDSSTNQFFLGHVVGMVGIKSDLKILKL